MMASGEPYSCDIAYFFCSNVSFIFVAFGYDWNFLLRLFKFLHEKNYIKRPQIFEFFL